MSTVRPFRALRPDKKYADKVISLPYDVMNRKEASEMAEGNPYSFLHICRAESDMPEQDNAYDRSVYEKARDNITAAQKAGLDVGVYVFSQAVDEKEAVEEADLTIKQLRGLKLQLPVVFDPETILDDEARTDNVSGMQFTDNTIAFCEHIREAGFEPMIYSNMVWEGEMFELDRLQEYPVWYADYEIPAQTPYAFRFWQYSEKGKTDGVQGAVDLNLEFVKE